MKRIWNHLKNWWRYGREYQRILDIFEYIEKGGKDGPGEKNNAG